MTINISVTASATTSSYTTLITDDDLAAADFVETGKPIVIFNDNPGNGRHYLQVQLFDDYDGQPVGHAFTTMEFDGGSHEIESFENIEDAIGDLPRHCHSDAKRLADIFMRDVYPRWVDGTIDFDEADRLNEEIV